MLFILMIGSSNVIMIIKMMFVMIRSMMGLIMWIIKFSFWLVWFFNFFVILMSMELSVFDFLVMVIILMIVWGKYLFFDSGVVNDVFVVMFLDVFWIVFESILFFVVCWLIFSDFKMGILLFKSVFKIW